MSASLKVLRSEVYELAKRISASVSVEMFSEFHGSVRCELSSGTRYGGEFRDHDTEVDAWKSALYFLENWS